MLAFAKRHQKKLAAVAVATGSAAAAAYYWWGQNWWSRLETDAERRTSQDSTADLQGILQQRPHLQPTSVEEHIPEGGGQDVVAAPDVENHSSSGPEPLDSGLQRHFDSIQSISDSTTLPQALRDLQRHVARLTGVHQLLDLLREGKKGHGLAATPSGKLETWQQLKLAAFTNAAASAWLLALLDMLLRVQLNILGRHLFLASHLCSNTEMLAEDQGAETPGLQVSRRAQTMFLDYAHYLPERGSAAIVDIAAAAARKFLVPIDLTDRLGPSNTLGVLSRIHAEMEAQAGKQDWATFMLPSKAEEKQYADAYPPAEPDYTALQPAALLARDEEIVGDMLNEVREVIGTAKFHAALRASVQEVAGRVADGLASGEAGTGLDKLKLPLAKLIPRVSAAGTAALDPSSSATRDCLAAVSALGPVQQLCASVYSSGPPL
ncbi:hypothetical protein WJX84_011452 [Apatococcus fuscideae]|uniref:Peroxisomal assembly protein PEX3 n=1 Tax=Apatococcus fuscideae TaxID=2026836 RepID=A0AAW1SWJ0_9CHLO